MEQKPSNRGLCVFQPSVNDGKHSNKAETGRLLRARSIVKLACL